MRRLDDEILMAYADGALSEADRRLVETEITRDPQARRLITVYRSTTALARHAFGAPAWSEPPARLVALISARPHRSRTVHGWPVWLAGSYGTGGLAALGSLAILAVLASAVWQLIPARHDAAPADGNPAHVAVGPVPRESELARVLDDLSADATHRRDRRFSLVATLTDKWGNTCKEVDARRPSPDTPPAFVLLACRVGAERWTVVGAVAPAVDRNGSRHQFYVRSEADAHDALSGILAMIGAKQRASALKPETTQQ
jgi:hypothetical protein